MRPREITLTCTVCDHDLSVLMTGYEIEEVVVPCQCPGIPSAMTQAFYDVYDEIIAGDEDSAAEARWEVQNDR